MTAEIVLLHPERELARVMEEEEPLAAWLTPMILEVRMARAITPDHQRVGLGMFGVAI